jgi:hypothetical protein
MRLKPIVGVAVLAGGLAAGPALGAVVLEIGETIALETDAATLQETVRAIAEAVPLALVERGAPPEDQVSLSIEVANWPGLFGRLLGRESHLLTIDPVTGQPTQLVVRWRAVRADRADAPAATSDEVEAQIRAAAKEVLAPRDVTGDAIDRLEEARDAFEAARGSPNEAAARQAYLDAIDDLDTHDEPRAVEALVPTLETGDREVRLVGLETLRELSRTGRAPGAVAAAIDAFETAEDDAVERAAIEVLVRYGDQREVMQMLEPLALSDGPNRDIAVREWLRIRDEEFARESIARTGDPQLRGQ